MAKDEAQISALVRLLAEEQQLSSTEIAETLWLALQIEPKPELQTAPANEEAVSSDESLSQQPELDVPDSSPPVPQLEVDVPRVAPRSSSPRSNVITEPQPGVLPTDVLPIWLSDAAILSNPLALMRALKPLLQQIKAGAGRRLDEAATVESIARTSLWLPVLQPETEPWFDVILVVDSSASMHLWRQLATDLERIFNRYGAFRNLQVYDLVVDAEATEDAVRLVSQPDRPGHHPGELIEQRGRRIAIVLSDCAAAYWWDGKLLPMLQSWMKAMPTVVWQMLPEWMWERTALGRGQLVSLSNSRPGAANQQLQMLPIGREVLPDASSKRLPIPVVTSAPGDLKNWGLMLSGDRRELTPGYLLPEAGGPVPKAKTLEEIARERVGDDEAHIEAEIDAIASRRISRFLQLASPAARRLVMLLAAAPVITLPVMRLIRHGMMAEEPSEARSPLPVAEVFLSGLLRRLPEQEGTGAQPESGRSHHNDRLQYSFIPRVRNHLLKILPAVDTIDVVNQVSAVIEERWNTFSKQDFRAFLTNQSVEAPAGLADLRSFASVTAEILESLGGQYAEFVKELRQGAAASENPIVAESQDLEEIEGSPKADRQAQSVESRIKMLLTDANRLARNGKYSQAIGQLNKILDIDSAHLLATEKKEEYERDLQKKAMPLGPGPFAKGRYAKDVEKDLKKSEILFRQAIREDDKFESAVKDLAQVYQQQGKIDAAIELLLDHRNKISKKEPVDNLLSHMYAHAGRYVEAIERFKTILENTPNSEKNSLKIHNVLTMLSYCHYQLKEYDEAEAILERALEINPEGETANSRLLALREAKVSGIYEEADKYFLELDTQPFVEKTLSDFLAFQLQECDYAGVEAAKIATKDFSEEDVHNLDELANQLGFQRPRDRASYYLSAAKILVDKGQQPEEDRPSLFLRNFCAAMGDACISEQKDWDVARSYYAEAFLIAPRWVPQLEVKLSQFIMLYYADGAEELLKKQVPRTEDSLEAAFNLNSDKKNIQVVQGLLDLSRLNPGVLRFLMDWVYRKPNLRHQLQVVCYQILEEAGEPNDDRAAFLSLWERGQEHMQQIDRTVKENIAYLHSSSSNLDTLEASVSKVQELENKMLGALDRKRLSQVRQVLRLISSEYLRQQAYAEREYSVARVENSISKTVKLIEDSPTKYSFELFRPYLIALGHSVKEHFNEIQKAAESEPLRTELAIESYPNQTDIECQIAIFNESGKIPVSDITLFIQDSSDGDYAPLQQLISVNSFLPGENSQIVQVPLSVTPKARESEVFTLHYTLSYIARQTRHEIDETLSVPLYSVTDFRPIKNPYAAYAQGTVVKDEEMFYGRDQLINNIISGIQQTGTARSFVIYGQKRVGKTSLIYHLEERMQFPFVPISFSIGDIVSSPSATSFIYRIILEIKKAFDDLEDSGQPPITVASPSLEAVERNPELRFQDYMAQIQRFFDRSQTYRNVRIVLLIDEFSYMYTAIQSGSISPEFMRFWKALLERDYFRAVMVGQNVMRNFIDQFPNEFQVATIKLDYLDAISAKALIENPIRIRDTIESRYRGNAVNQLLNITAGSPYYIQIFCNRLVDYMNRKKAKYVTDVDIATVMHQELLNGNQSLIWAQFDNLLLSASDDLAGGITSQDTEKVLMEIARNSRHQEYCDRATINVTTDSASVDAILIDLCRCEVLKKKGRSMYKIRIGLFKEWLLVS